MDDEDTLRRALEITDICSSWMEQYGDLKTVDERIRALEGLIEGERERLARGLIGVEAVSAADMLKYSGSVYRG